jgi:hypothetical protein
MKNVGMHIAIALVLQTLCFTSCYAQKPGSPQFSDEFLKQDRIYRGRGVMEIDGYVTDRSLTSYTLTLSKGFDRSLANLGPDDRWLDVGAGQGNAILDYYSFRYDLMRGEEREQRGAKAEAVGLSIEDRRTPLWEQTAANLRTNQIQYLCNKRLRDYSLAELGQFEVITDVFGGFSYADNFSSFTQKALNHLELNGTFYTVLQDVMFNDRSNHPYYSGSPFLTEITGADGQQVSVCSWLKSISCVEVTCEAKTNFRPPIEAYSVRKVCNDVKVPQVELTHYEAGTPPERGYRKLAK